MLPGYGRELFARFVPPSARARLDARSAPDVRVLSGALVARQREALGGPVVEVRDPGRAALAGILRAARQADAVIAVSVDAASRGRSPQAARSITDEILQAAVDARFDRPLILVARAAPLAAGASVERLSEALYRDLEAGFTSFGFLPHAFAGDIDELMRVTAPLVEQDLGLEVELDGSADPAFVLARIDDAGLALAAIRGASAMDELGGALLVVDAVSAAALPGAPARAIIDAGLTRLDSVADGERREAAAWLDASGLFSALGATGTSTRLLDALARSLR